MRALLATLLVVLLASPALAQTIGSPLQGKYEDSYTVFGRALDSRGLPVRGGVAMIELEQEGVQMVPLRAGINCKGDIITEFTLKHVDPRGKAKVTVIGPEGLNNATGTAPLDPFFRRSDVLVRLPVAWPHECADEKDVWPVSASISVRILNRTAEYLAGEEPMFARPFKDILSMRYEPPDGNRICPPHPQDQTPGSCELFQADERGDIRYTFTLDQPFVGGGNIVLTSVTNETWIESIPIDPVTRLGVKLIEASGQGPPPGIYEAPGPGVALLLVAIAAMAFSRRRR